MTFQRFQRSRKRLEVSQAPEHCRDIAASDPLVTGVFLYHDGFFILEMTGGRYWLVLGLENLKSQSLRELEALLYLWIERGAS